MNYFWLRAHQAPGASESKRANAKQPRNDKEHDSGGSHLSNTTCLTHPRSISQNGAGPGRAGARGRARQRRRREGAPRLCSSQMRPR